MAKHIVVVGGGICGVSSAIWLRRAGHDVTMIDRGIGTAAASYGNAGLLAQWAIIPVTTPGLMKTGIKYLFDSKAPLFLRWAYFPKLLPWLLKYLSYANASDAARIVSDLIPIVMDSVDQHRALAAGTPAERWIETSDFTYAYPSRAAFEGDKFGWDLRAKAGLIPEIIEGGAVREVEPILSKAIGCLAILRQHGHILNPGAYVADLTRGFADMGGRVMMANVKDFDLVDGHVQAVDTDQGRVQCDAVVMAAGIHSEPLMRKLGLKVPLETERGYHVIYKSPSRMPRTPMMMMTGKFAVTPMEMGLRCAGTVEFGGTQAGPSKKPTELIRHFIKEAFDDFTCAETEEWMGFRPSTPDSLPMIGEAGIGGVYAAFGHQHVGLTGGPKTGRLVADMISGRHPNMDLRPYDPRRFS